MHPYIAKECALPARLLGTALLALFMLNTAAYGQITTLHSFTGTPDGSQPAYVTLAQGRDGQLYGTTSGGGSSGLGSMFRFAPQGLELFSLDGTEGITPFGGVTLRPDGLFCGTAEYGGPSQGAVFSVTSSGAFTLLHSFEGSDGGTPTGALATGPDGTCYGLTQYGGANGFGTVYGVSPSGTLTLLHSFSGADGSNPRGGGLLLTPEGVLFGMTSSGGAHNLGTIFSVSLSGTFKTIADFDGANGSQPAGTLIRASDGNIYGATNGGGANGDGTVFQLSSGVPRLTVLHSFGGLDGSAPTGGLVEATDGNLYGATSGGGANGDGVIYSITPSGTFTTIYSFDGVHGTNGNTLMQHTDGRLYATTYLGGAAGLGTIYSLDLGLGPFVTFVFPSGRAGSSVQILGTGLMGATAVTFNGVPAASFTVQSGSFIVATVPTGATTGPVQVTTPGGTLTSNKSFVVLP
jgi:uncharacterized repeat protein (TIGR03803 family)